MADRRLALGVGCSALGVGLTALVCALPANADAPAKAERPIVIKAGRILTVTKGTIDNGVLIIRGSKIAAIGMQSEVPIPADAEIIDASDRWVMPGQIDLHAHLGNNSGLHDYVHTLNPEFRVYDFIDPDATQVQDQIASGITVLNTIPGSGGNHSGFGVVWKLGGAPRDQLILRKLGSMKIAQAYNPERRAGDLGLSRMGMWWMLREMFARAKKYDTRMAAAESATRVASLTNPKLAKAPKRQPELDNLREVIEKRTPVFVHTAGARDVFQTMHMFHDEMNLPVIVSHGEFGGFKVAQEAAKRSIPVNVGPRLYDFSSQVYDRTFYSIPGQYASAGVQNLSLNTDCPVIPGDDLFIQGTLSVKLGMDEDLALRALTINPAKAIGIDDRVGSLEVGKDADIVIKKGSLFDIRTPVDRVLINGKTVYHHGQKRKLGGHSTGSSGAVDDDDGCGLEHDADGNPILNEVRDLHREQGDGHDR